MAPVLRQFIQKQHASMRQGNFARLQLAASPNQRHATDSMVRRPKRWRSPRLRGECLTGDRPYRSHLKRFGFTQARQQRGQRMSQHRLTGSRRPRHQQIVCTRSSDQQRPFRLHLAFDVLYAGQLRTCIRRLTGGASALAYWSWSWSWSWS